MRASVLTVLVVLTACKLPDEPRTGQDLCDDVAAATCDWANRCDPEFYRTFGDYTGCIVEATTRCCVANVDCDERVAIERDRVDDYYKCIGNVESASCDELPTADCDG